VSVGEDSRAQRERRDAGDGEAAHVASSVERVGVEAERDAAAAEHHVEATQPGERVTLDDAHVVVRQVDDARTAPGSACTVDVLCRRLRRVITAPTCCTRRRRIDRR